MYVVKNNKKIFLLFSFLVLCIITVILAAFLGIKAEGKTWLVFLYISLPFLLLYIIGLIDFLKFKIIINKEKIIVIKTFSKRREYLFEDIKSYHFYNNSLYVEFNDKNNISVNTGCKNYKRFAAKISDTGKLRTTINFPLILNKDKINDNYFVIRQKKTSLILITFFILFVIALIFLAIFADIKTDTTLTVFMSIFIAFLIILIILCIIEVFRFNIIIDKNNIIITPVFGRKRYYQLQNISNITGIPSGARLHFDDGKKFNLHYTFKTNIDLFIDLFTEKTKKY